MSGALATNRDQVTVIEHASFAVSDTRGDMVPGSYHGCYVADTRCLSRLVLRVANRRLESLSAETPDHNRASFHLTTPMIGRLPEHSVSVLRQRVIGEQITERIRVTSYATQLLHLHLSVELDADFLDIFEVLGRVPMRRTVASAATDGGVRFAYGRTGYRRTTTVSVDRPFAWHDGRVGFELQLEHGVPWELELGIESHEDAPVPTPRGWRRRTRRTMDPARIERWAARVPQLESDDPRLVTTWKAAVRDMRALLLAEPGGSFIPAAGVPWFMAVFGRDASITALQSLIAGSDIAYGTLRELASFQGRHDDRFRDEERGKIPHEVRRGELAALDRVPHARYYGSADATPLYVRLFAESCRWTGWLTDAQTSRGPRAPGAEPIPEALGRLLPAIERALGWMDHAVEADGLIWYQRRHRTGIENQAWKDSYDSYRFVDGKLARTPIAALEVQGYAVAAWRGLADVFEALDRRADADRLRAAAEAMVSRIDDAFWMPGAGTFAMGIDRHGRQIDAITSNPGHLLWAGAVSPERASRVAERLTAPDMFTGWGIRTMSSEMAAYNPVSYHNGSIWPHDNSLILAGLARYGETARAWQVADALLDTAMSDPDARLPELFGGFDRSATTGFVRYPVACAPQAWATGAIFLIVQTLLGLTPNGDSPRLSPLAEGPPVRLTDARAGYWRGHLDSGAPPG